MKGPRQTRFPRPCRRRQERSRDSWVAVKLRVLPWAAGILLAAGADAWAARLPSAAWSPAALTNLTDGNLATTLTLTNRQVTIDLGRTCTVHRVFLTGPDRQLHIWPEDGTRAPLGLAEVYVGEAAHPTQRVGFLTVPYDAGNPADTEVDVRFSPVATRYVRIELRTNVVWGVEYWPGTPLPVQPPPPSRLAWRVAELEVYGFEGVFPKSEAVVLPPGAAAPLSLAAADLSYYLGELGGKPVPIVAPSVTNQYPGVLYCVEDLAPLAPTYGAMVSNMATGRLPTNVNVEIGGRTVRFRAWPYRCVLWSAWEFLERQGVRWLYPDGQGDDVPAGGGIRLDMLPLRVAPSARSIYANWDVSSLRPWPWYQLQSQRQGYLHIWRNRWNGSWGGSGPLGGDEIPRAPAPGGLHPDYAEEFAGYPHNFDAVVPNRILLAGDTNWWGFDRARGVRVTPGTENVTFCMNHPALVNWVADKVRAVEAAQPVASRAPLAVMHAASTYNLLPMDATRYCEDSAWCLPANGPPRPPGDGYGTITTQSFSGSYFSFVAQVATNVSAHGSSATIGALAYADVYDPPPTLVHLPSNVQVEVCLYGAPNLLTSSHQNAGLRAVWEGWHAKAARLATYDYALLHTDTQQPDPRLPVPLVSALADRARYLARLGALNGGCQATPESLPYNPWNFYAYPRVRWDTNLTAAALLQEFFRAGYRETAAPVSAYYSTLENYLVSNNVSLRGPGYCYAVTPGSFPLAVLSRMRTALETAEGSATNWVVKERVARIREGFAWVILQRELVGVNLDDSTPYTDLLTNGTITLDLAALDAPTNRPGGNFAFWFGSEWWFGAQGSIRSTFHVLKAGTYRVIVHAKGVPFRGVAPVLDVYLGPARGRAVIASTSFTNYTFALAVPAAGVWDLVLDYNNAAAGGARNIVVDGIQVRGPFTPRGTPYDWLYRYYDMANGETADDSDTDGDGMVAWKEYHADTDPTNRASCLRVTALTNGSPLTVCFPSSSRRLYTLLHCTNLGLTAWTNVPGAGPRGGVGGPDRMTDTRPPPDRGFYRIGVCRPPGEDGT